MRKWLGIVTALILEALLAAPLAADEPAPTTAAGTQPPAELPSPPVKTGKERLSGKAADEQRVDNCKVPPELRGTVPRPDACESKAQATATH
jgi:hypothetical protein